MKDAWWEIEFGYVELKHKRLFMEQEESVQMRIVCKVRIISPEGRGRYDSWVQLDLG